jgi:hypothetical protein
MRTCLCTYAHETLMAQKLGNFEWFGFSNVVLKATESKIQSYDRELQ